MKLNRKFHLAASASGIFLVAIASRAEADPASLWIINPSDVEVKLSVSGQNGDYEGPTGANVLTIPAGGEALRKSGRDSSGGGKVGRAKYYFEPSPIGVHLDVQIHGGNGYWILNAHSNRYPGTFISKKDRTQTNPHPNQNTFILAKAPPMVPREGAWVAFCAAGGCKDKKHEVEKRLEQMRNSSRSQSDEIRTKREICTTVAGRGAVYSAEVNGCLSREGTHRSDINLEDEMRNNLNVTMSQNFSLNEKKMSEARVGTVWQYVWKENKGNGWTNQPYRGKEETGRFTCPTGTAQPKYMPGSPENDNDNCARLVGGDY